MTKGKFLVLINSYYMRDTQVLHSDAELPNEESEEFFNLYEEDNNWKDIRVDGYLGIYDWDDDEEGLKRYISAKKGLPARILEVHKIERF